MECRFKQGPAQTKCGPKAAELWDVPAAQMNPEYLRELLQGWQRAGKERK